MLDEPLARAQKWCWWGVGFGCAGAVLQFGPMWLFMPMIIVSLCCTGAGYIYIQRWWRQEQRDIAEAEELEEKWRQQRERAR